MKRLGSIHGFTLVELLVTMGLMALLATVSIAGYYGAVRGMTERGVRQDVISFLRMTRQRADIDQVPTAVFFENRMLRDENQDMGETKRVVGVAIAVRRSGRLTYVDGNYLSDEFGDLSKTYSTNRTSSSGGGNKGMSLYRVQGNSSSSFEGSYSTVRDYVVRRQLGTEEMFGLGATGGNLVTLPDNSSFSANSMTIWAFEKTGGGGSASWRVGDAYGMEIASIQLPHGFVFGSSIPSQVGEGRSGGNPVFFVPNSGRLASISGSMPDIRSYRPSKEGVTLKSIGKINDSDLKDD